MLLETDDMDVEGDLFVSCVDEADGIRAVFSSSAPIFDACWHGDVLWGVPTDEIFVQIIEFASTSNGLRPLDG